MLLNKMRLISLLVIVTSCSAQEKNNTQYSSAQTKTNPIIVRNFKAAALPPDFDTTLVSQYIRSIFQDSQGNLWFGTLGEGVVRYDVNALTYFSNPDGFINQSVFAINEDKNGNMWFGTDQGVYKYDGKTFKNYNQKDGLNQQEISRNGILLDKNGTLLVCTHSGVYQYNPLADANGAPCFSLFTLLNTTDVSSIFESKNGNIWFASTDRGLFCYDGKTITNFASKVDLGNIYAGGIAEDKNGHMWFTTKNGISKFDGKTFTAYTAKDGLGGTEIWGIYIEKSGIIWVTARGSTTRFDPSIGLPNPKAFTVFTPVDGLNCCVQSMFQDKSGNMWWGTGSGLYRFDGKRFYQVKHQGPW